MINRASTLPQSHTLVALLRLLAFDILWLAKTAECICANEKGEREIFMSL